LISVSLPDKKSRLKRNPRPGEETIMSKFDWTKKSTAGIAILFLAMAVAQAQENRTFVSVGGDDANKCRQATPCKTFQGALVKTNPGGEIDVLDSGGFGAVNINKAVTIDGSGVVAGALATSTVKQKLPPWLAAGWGSTIGFQ